MNMSLRRNDIGEAKKTALSADFYQNGSSALLKAMEQGSVLYLNSKGTDAEQTSTAKLKDIVRQDIQTKRHGVQIQASFYERRAYLEERGARKIRESYHCAAVAKISLKNLQELLEAYKSETTAGLEHKTETLKLERRRKEALVNAIGRTSEGLSAAVGSM